MTYAEVRVPADIRGLPTAAVQGGLACFGTSSSFVGLSTSVDDDGQPVVVALRTDKDLVNVEHMSDGTRDQLFLAFRIACIEDYCAKSEPLPFVADDVLVHFDDERGAATLELLAELGRMTQVLVFTHHRAVLDAAQPLVRAGRARFAELGVRNVARTDAAAAGE